MDDYDIVFLGYPIWWGEEPRIIDTFLESYDFSDKTVIPFCTSGSSGICPPKELKLVPGFTVNETKKLCLQKVQLKFLSEI